MTLAFTADALVDRIGWLLVHSLWQFGLIAMLLAAALRVLRRAAAGTRYVTALVGWGAMLVAPAVTWPLLPAPDQAMVSVENAAVGVPRLDGQPGSDGFPAEVATPTVMPVGVPFSGRESSLELVPAEDGTRTTAATWTEALTAVIAPWLNTLVVVWCVGMCVFAARSARGWCVVRRLLHRDVAAVPDALTSVLARVAKQIGLRHRVRLLQSPHVAVPMAVGWLKPVILLPVCVVTGFSPQQLEAILAHELAHVRRHDYLINLVQNLSETVCFYHPALWWASAVVRREREHCCDELAARALGNRAEYGRALLALEELRGATPAFAVGAKTGSLVERIRRLAQLEPTPRISAGGVVGIVLVGAMMVSAAVWGAGVVGESADAENSATELDKGDNSPAEFAIAVADRFAAVAAEASLPFLGETEIAALGEELHDYLATRVQQSPSDDIRRSALDAIGRWMNRLGRYPDAYLRFRPEFNMLCWQLWVLAERRDLTAAELGVREQQREWMRDYIRNLPQSANEDRNAKHRDSGRVVPLETYIFNNPLSPFFHTPMSDAEFSEFQRLFKERNRGDAANKLTFAPAHMFYAVVRARYRSYLERYPPGFPVGRIATDDEDEFNFSRRATNVAGGILGYDRVYDFDRAPSEIVSRTSGETGPMRFAEKNPAIDLVFHPEKGASPFTRNGTLIPVNGARLATLDTNQWHLADRIPLAEIRARIANFSRESFRLFDDESMPEVGYSALDEAAVGLPILAVETAEGAIATIRISAAFPDGLHVTIRLRPLTPNPPFHTGDEVALSDEFEDPKRPFVVRGRVTDENRQPLPGVEVVAHSGIATLFPTGSAITGDDGTYTLRFGPGMLMDRSETAPLSVGVQAATISPRLGGWYEVNLHQQGDLAIADHPLSNEERKGWAGYRDIIQPETPYELNFVMARGATIEGRLVNEFGKPIAGEDVTLDGDDLPPSSSALDSAKTDDDGRFRFQGVPLHHDWHFKLRIHGTRHEITGDAFRFERPEARELELTLETDKSADGKAEFRLEQTQKPISSTADAANDGKEPNSAAAPPDDLVHVNIVAARHVLLLDGKQITTWKEIDDKIAALPDPTRAYPHLYVTRGAMEVGLDDQAQAEAHELHRKYNLTGHSIGSLLPRIDYHYDRIVDPEDLVPDPALRREGTVVDKDGNPVAGAEVVLITPVDESLPYKAYDIAIVEGRVRNPVNEILTRADDAGRFAVYPARDAAFSLLAVHPDHGIALSDSAWFAKDSQLKLLPWGGIVAEFSEEPEDQTASLRTRLDARDGRPEISLNQFWSDLKRPDPTLTFELTHVPPIWQTSISRDFTQPDGGSTDVSGAWVSVLPGETRTITLGPVTKQQRELLEDIRNLRRPRAEAAVVDGTTVVQDTTGESPGEAASEVEIACVDADGQPVSGAEVYVFQHDGGDPGRYEQSGPFTTDANGRIAGLKPVVRDEAGHFDRFYYARVPGQLVGVARSAHWKGHAVFNGEGRVEMRPSQTVAGRVRVPPGADPTKVTVRVQTMHVVTGEGTFAFQSWPREDHFPGLNTALGDIFERRPASDGTFEFADMPVRAQLYVFALADGFGEAQWSNYKTSTFDKPIDLHLVPEGILAGRVTVQGKPVAGIEVSARRIAGPYISTTRTVSDENGAFRLRGLAATRFNVTVNDPQQRWVCRPHEEVSIFSGESASLDLELTAPIVVSGRVVDAAGAPVAGAAISALTDTRNDVGLDHDVTGDDGLYELRLPPGGAQFYFNSLPEGFAYPDPQIIRKRDIKPGEAAIDFGDYAVRRSSEAAVAAAESPVTEQSPEPEPASAKPQAEEAAIPDQDADGGSKLLREIRRKSKPLLAALAEKHGYGLAEGEDVKRVPMPFDPARMEYYRVGHPSQSQAIPRGPEAILFHWKDESLTNWSMTFADPDNPGQSLAGLCEWILERKTQDIEGPTDLLQQAIPGDWVLRLGASEESRLAQLNKILSSEAAMPVRLAFRMVQRPVYVAEGVYNLTPLPGESGEDQTQLTDGVRVSDKVFIFGNESDLKNGGAGGGCGDFDEFLSWLGRWIESPIINDVETGPMRDLCWSQHEANPFTDEEHKLAHDPERVLANITKQTGLTFAKEDREVRMLFVEEANNDQ